MDRLRALIDLFLNDGKADQKSCLMVLITFELSDEFPEVRQIARKYNNQTIVSLSAVIAQAQHDGFISTLYAPSEIAKIITANITGLLEQLTLKTDYAEIISQVDALMGLLGKDVACSQQ